MNPEDEVAVGSTERSVSRRQALKQGAVAGGALLWVAPAMQAITISSAHAQTASGQGAGGGGVDNRRPLPPPEVAFPSSIQVAVKRSSDGTVFGLSFDGGRWGAISSGGACFASTLRYSSPDHAAAAAFAGIDVSRDSSSGTYDLALPGGYTLVAGHAKCGQGCRPARQSGRRLAFRCS